MVSRGLALVVLLLPAALSPAGAAAQLWGGADAPDSLAAFTQRVDSILLAGEVAPTLELLERRLEEDDVYALRWRAARAAVALGILAETSEAARPHLRTGIRHGEAAVELDPAGLDGRYWRLAAKGRLGMTHRGAIRGAELAEEIWTEAHALLERDPDHPGAHNALGRLHLEIQGLPGWKRIAGQAVAGVLRRGSWEDAEEHLRRAVELDPGQILFRKDLGELFVKTERTTAARILLEQVVAMEPRHPLDPVFLDEARALLRELDGDGARR